MRALKTALDPENLMNPGKVIPSIAPRKQGGFDAPLNE